MDADARKKRQESCSHPSFSQERIRGMGTGDYLCDDCGADRDTVKATLKCGRCGEPITDFRDAIQVTVAGEGKRYHHARCIGPASDPPLS